MSQGKVTGMKSIVVIAGGGGSCDVEDVLAVMMKVGKG
jgi:hypothetical protein